MAYIGWFAGLINLYKWRKILANALKTILFSFHKEMGGKMVPFAGYEMPLQYKSGIMKEHLFCRESAALFDVSHMGQIILRAKSKEKNAVAKSLESLIPIDLINLRENRQRYGFLLNDKGGIIDDLMISNRGEYFIIVANASRKDIDFKLLQEKLGDELEIKMLADKALVAIQGPKSEEALSKIFNGISDMSFLDVNTFFYEGQAVEISRSGYTGEDGFEISISNSLVEKFSQTVLEDPSVKLAGLGARDSLRLEGSLCLYGQDISEDISPIEAGLAWAIQKSRREGGEREGNFPGSNNILSQIKNGVEKRRIGLAPDGKAPIRAGTKLFSDKNGSDYIGRVTSGGYSPSLSKPISMAYIFGDDNTNENFFAEVRGAFLPVRKVKMPFMNNNFKR